MAKIVFILHEASRTGAPFTQLHLMRWLKQNTDYQMMLIIINGGDLIDEFKQLAEVYIVNKPYVAQSISRRISNKLTQLYRPDSEKLFRKIQQFNPDLIFANTAVVLSYAASLKRQIGVRLVSYLHELEITFFHISPQNFAIATEQVDEFIMGSHAVSNYYQKTFAVSSKKAHVIYDFIEGVEEGNTKDIRKEYDIASEVLIIGAMASIVWRKGPELFIEVARRVLKVNSNVRFMWVGGKKNSATYQEAERDIRLLGLEGKIIMAGEQVDIHSYYKAFDIFLLTSREDPFPLVCLEAALSYTPIGCFAQAGGMPEFVRDDAGFVVPYLDLDAMAVAVLELLHDDSLRQQQAKVAHDRVLKMCTIDVVGPQIVQLLETVMA